MKKLLLSLSIALFSGLSFAQVTFYVDPPSVNSGNFTNTFADPSGGDWACPDMTDPANAITGTLVMGRDATVADTLGCDPLINSAAIMNNIAVIYRGDCEFGVKALNAQNAGAIAIVLINHTGEPVGMAGGAQGANVTIPVIMISENAGAALHDEIIAGGVTCFIGNKFGYFADDIGMGQKDVLRAKAFSNIQELSQDATEFNVKVGTWIYNFGTNDQTVVETTCQIMFGGSSVYNEVSSPATILSGDSLFVSLPDFSQASYANGYYNMTYSVSSAVNDEFMDDNSVDADFAMSDDLLTYSRVDQSTMMPITQSGYRPSQGDNIYSSCVQFSDPNASRMGVKGITFSASTANSGPITGVDGKLVEVEAYEWNDNVTDLNDAGFSIEATAFITSGEYTFEGDWQDSMVYAQYDTPFALVDNQHYLFCVTTYDLELYLGFDPQLDYDENITDAAYSNGEPTTVVQSDNGFAGTGFGTDLSASIGVNFFPIAELGVEELEANTKEKLEAYPNPAVDMITIPFTNHKGNATINIVDVTGKIVSTQIVNLTDVNKLNLNVNEIEAGIYVFNVTYENGNTSTFNVVINK